MKKQKIILLLSLLCIVVSAYAQQPSMYTKSIRMTNGKDSVELYPQDQLPYSFFKTGSVRSPEDSLCKTYTLFIVYFKGGKGKYAITNHYQWSDTIVQSLIQAKPDSLLLHKTVQTNDKSYSNQFHLKLVY